MRDLEVIAQPDDMWLTRLRHGHFVYAPKQERYAQVDWAWEPPEPGTVSGRIAICFVKEDGDGWSLTGCESWFIKPDGTGFDGLPLLLPIEDNCPDEATPIPEPWQRQVQRELSYIVHRLEQMEFYYTGLFHKVLSLSELLCPREEDCEEDEDD